MQRFDVVLARAPKSKKKKQHELTDKINIAVFTSFNVILRTPFTEFVCKTVS